MLLLFVLNILLLEGSVLRRGSALGFSVEPVSQVQVEVSLFQKRTKSSSFLRLTLLMLMLL